jgi:hypothetical protein
VGVDCNIWGQILREWPKENPNVLRGDAEKTKPTSLPRMTLIKQQMANSNWQIEIFCKTGFLKQFKR